MPPYGFDLRVGQGFLQGKPACFGRRSQIAVEGLLEGAPVSVAKGFGVGAELNENKVGLKGLEKAGGPHKTAIVTMDGTYQDQRVTIGARTRGSHLRAAISVRSWLRRAPVAVPESAKCAGWLSGPCSCRQRRKPRWPWQRLHRRWNPPQKGPFPGIP